MHTRKAGEVLCSRRKKEKKKIDRLIDVNRYPFD
jgi:hypothetical protein